MDLDALREATAALDLFDDVLDRWYLDETTSERLVAAAVALDESLHLIRDTLRAVLDSEEAWECGTYSTVHFDESLEDDGSCSHCRSAAVMAGCGPVVVVRRRLLAEEKL